MWASKPHARVGIKTGLACGCGCESGPDVLDFDVADGKPGIDQRRALVDAGVIDGTASLRVRTPSGGEHWWFAGTTQHNKQNDDSVWGVDLRAHHGMVLAPGNPGYTILGVPWGALSEVDWTKVAACPGIIVKAGKPAPVPPARGSLPRPKTGRLVAPSQFDNAPGEESPLDWLCRNTDLGAVLVADGWSYAYSHEGRDYYARPGKSIKDGVSANIMLNADGRQTIMNFSTTVTWLPTDRGLSAAQYIAHRDHGGDMRAAARHIRRTLMPQRQPTTPPVNYGAPAGIAGGAGAAGSAESTRSAELIPASQAGVPDPVRDFWQQRRELMEVWWKARVGGVSPWAILGNVLASVAGRVGPHVTLPPLGGVGAAASLNLLVAISGNSGTGKGRSGPIAYEFMGAPYPPQRKPGTGQGIAAMFTEQTKEGPVQSNDTVVLNVAEITQLGAHMGQQGATITSTLLEVYMGEELGEHYANKELRRPVRNGHYRLAMVAGVQPGNSHIIFDHAESGLPQRFVWLPAFWPDAILPDGPLEPPAPGSELPRWRAWSAIVPGSLDDEIEIGQPAWTPGDALRSPTPGKKPKEPEAIPVPIKDRLLIEYDPAVSTAIRKDHSRRLNEMKRRQLAGEDDPGDPDSHLVLTRAKVAALLAIWLDHSTRVTWESWERAGWVMWVSNDTRIAAQRRLQAKASDKANQRAASQVAVQRAVQDDAERTRNAVYIRACDRLLHVVGAVGDWTTMRVINQKLSSKEKREMRDADVVLADVLGDLVLAGKLETRETDRSGNVAVEWKSR